MRVALCQIIAGADPQENLATITAETEAAAATGASVVVFPEAAMCRFGVPLAHVAEPLDGPWATSIRELALRLGVLVVAGMFTPGTDGRIANTLLVTGPGVENSYNKIHLFDAFGHAESASIAPGFRPVVVQHEGVRLGVATCYDLRFPELFRDLARRGAEVILVPASWGAGPGKAEQWTLLTRARAADTTSYLLACDQADPAAVGGIDPGDTAPRGIGLSAAIRPDGHVLQALDAGPGRLVVDLDLGEVAAVRARIPVLANARADLWPSDRGAGMSKPELEFAVPSGGWTRPAGSADGIWEQVLAGDPAGGEATLIQRYEPGTDMGVCDPIVHDYWEEVILLSGELTDTRLQRTFTAGSYACRPPGMVHGPYRSEGGCTMFIVMAPDRTGQPTGTGAASPRR